MTGRSAAGPCGGGGVCQRHLAAGVAARDSPAKDGGRTDNAELSIALSDELSRSEGDRQADRVLSGLALVLV